MDDELFHFSAPDLSDSEKLRELLTAVRGFSFLLHSSSQRLATYHELLSDELDGNARAEDFLNHSVSLLGQLSEISETLKSVSDERIVGDQLDVASMLHGLQNRLSSLLSAKQLEMEVESDDMHINGELFQIQQMLTGMAEDLLPFAEQLKSPLELHGYAEQFTDVQLHAMGADCLPGEYAVIDFLTRRDGDSAPVEYGGMTDYLLTVPDNQARLFQLANWLGVMRRHGGDLLMPKKNDIYGYRMLLSQTSHKAAAQSASEEEIVGGKETILLVDDEDMIWDLVIDMLMNLGYTVILAANGKEAVETYSSNIGSIDLVIMDMVMPGMNGREAFECLKKLDPNVKVLLSSGYVSEEDAQFVMKAGALGFLRKPYRMHELAKVIRRLLDENK